MRNLVIGHSSQLGQYFPDTYIKTSSRNINVKYLQNYYYDRIYLCFGEHRTFLDDEKLFIDINYNYTLEIIDQLKSYCNNIIVYSTAELWNKYNGKISLDLPFDYFDHPYLVSKDLLCTHLLNNNYTNTIIIYPVNFNSRYRRAGSLFGNIYDALFNNKHIILYNINFNRDLSHPQIIVNKSIESINHKIIGSGYLINIKKLISDMFDLYNKKYDQYIAIDNTKAIQYYTQRNEYYAPEITVNYKELLNLMCSI